MKIIINTGPIRNTERVKKWFEEVVVPLMIDMFGDAEAKFEM